ncbi:DCC family protein At1g52590, chloroplastic-like [Primulina tabacum]|uniref:DCC family protein At1g52590, chloroplastic-like n=1 Tax=Primulina tabacum TaxID=48773 RepID=UPI003F59D41B
MVLVVISMSAAFFSICRIRYCERTNLNISLTGMALIFPAKCSSVAVPLLPHLSPRRRGIILSPSLSPSTEVDWVKETSSFFEKDPRPIMLFDGVCNLCNGGVKFVRNNDRKRNIRFEALQSEVGKKLLQRSGRAPDDISSVVLVDKDRSYIKSEAVLKIMQYIDLPFPQLALFLQFIPLFIRDFVYDNVADNRYSFFGRSDSCDL